MSTPIKLNYERLQGEVDTLVQRDFTPCFRTGYYKVNGVFVPEYFKEFGDRILQMPIRDSDIWVCSYPKTGTTWTQEMVWCLANDLDYERAQVFLAERFPFLEHSPLFDYRNVFAKNPDMEVGEHVTDSVGFINKLNSPRFVKSHLPFHLLPVELQLKKTNAKIIYVCRNPKDTCVSYYHHCCSFEGFTGSFKDFTKLFMNDAVCFSPYYGHIESFWNLRNEPNVLFLTYEEMKKDLPSVVRKTASFLGKTYTEEQLEVLCHHLSFESMKNNRATNYEIVAELNKKFKMIEVKGPFMRSGQIGGWKQTMSDETIKEFNKWIEEKFSALEIGWD